MIENGRMVTFNGKSAIGRIVGKTGDGRYIINSEMGNMFILALTQFSVL